MGKEGLQILTSILYLTVSGLLMSSSKVATSAGLEPTKMPESKSGALPTWLRGIKCYAAELSRNSADPFR